MTDEEVRALLVSLRTQVRALHDALRLETDLASSAPCADASGAARAQRAQQGRVREHLRTAIRGLDAALATIEGREPAAAAGQEQEP